MTSILQETGRKLLRGESDRCSSTPGTHKVMESRVYFPPDVASFADCIKTHVDVSQLCFIIWWDDDVDLFGGS